MYKRQQNGNGRGVDGIGTESGGREGEEGMTSFKGEGRNPVRDAVSIHARTDISTTMRTSSPLCTPLSFFLLQSYPLSVTLSLPPSRTVDRGGYTYVGKEGSKDEGGAGLIAGADAAAGHAKQSRGN